MIDSVVFIGAAIVALVQAVKYVFPNVSGIVTILVAILVGVLVGIFDVAMGIADVSVAQAVMTALAAVGIHTVAASTGTRP